MNQAEANNKGPSIKDMPLIGISILPRPSINRTVANPGCPLLLMATIIASGEDEGYIDCSCKEAGCSWWSSTRKCCGVAFPIVGGV